MPIRSNYSSLANVLSMHKQRRVHLHSFVAILQHLHNEEPPDFMFIYLTTFILNSHFMVCITTKRHIFSIQSVNGGSTAPHPTWKWKANFSVATKPINRSNEYYVFACATLKCFVFFFCFLCRLAFGIRIKMQRERRKACVSSRFRFFFILSTFFDFYFFSTSIFVFD